MLHSHFQSTKILKILPHGVECYEDKNAVIQTYYASNTQLYLPGFRHCVLFTCTLSQLWCFAETLMSRHVRVEEMTLFGKLLYLNIVHIPARTLHVPLVRNGILWFMRLQEWICTCALDKQ